MFLTCFQICFVSVPDLVEPFCVFLATIIALIVKPIATLAAPAVMTHCPAGIRKVVENKPAFLSFGLSTSNHLNYTEFDTTVL